MHNEKIIDDEDDDSVFYCSNCLSLNIKAVMPGISYCKECNCGMIEQTSFEDWESKYKERYGQKFLETKNDKTNECSKRRKEI